MTKKLNLPPDMLSARRRGNTTSGDSRRGFKGGRARLYPEGTVTYSVALKLADPEYRMAIWIGRGNASDGIRRALEAAYKANPPSGIEPLDRFEMEARVKKDKALRKLNLIKAKLGMRTPEEEATIDREDAEYNKGVAAPGAPDWDDVK